MAFTYIQQDLKHFHPIYLIGQDMNTQNEWADECKKKQNDILARWQKSLSLQLTKNDIYYYYSIQKC